MLGYAEGTTLRGCDPARLEPGRPAIAVPALMFVTREGTRGIEHFNAPLSVADAVAAQGGGFIPDSLAREYFERLACDEELKAEVRAAHEATFAPAVIADEEAFRRAFGDAQRAVPLDLPASGGAPFVSGDEYRRAPDLIMPHIHNFLDQLIAESETPGERSER